MVCNCQNYNLFAYNLPFCILFGYTGFLKWLFLLGFKFGTGLAYVMLNFAITQRGHTKHGGHMTDNNTTQTDTGDRATGATDTPFIDNSKLDLRAKPQATDTGATGATVTKPNKAKQAKARARAKALQAKGAKGIPTQDLVKWCVKAYSLTKLDRANGVVYHIALNGSHKKLIKIATWENKGGVFLGGMVNATMAPLATSSNNYLTVHHSKSNVYKVVRPTLTMAQMVTLQQAIVKVCGTPKVPVGDGLNLDTVA